MKMERKEELNQGVELLWSFRSQKSKNLVEKACYGLFFQYYFSVLFEEEIGEEFSFGFLYSRVEKGRFQWNIYQNWMNSFENFLSLMTGRQDVPELFDFLISIEEKEQIRPLERYARKAIRILWNLDVKKEEAEDFLALFLSCFFHEKKEECPAEFAECMVRILFTEWKATGKIPMNLYGTGKGLIPYELKQRDSAITLLVSEIDGRKDSFAKLVYFALDLEHRWVFPAGKEPIRLGASLWPYGETKEKEKNLFFPSACLPGQKEEYRCLDRWMSQLSEQGVFYFLCSAGFLYREGREKNLRCYLIEEKDLLDRIFFLPDDWSRGGFPKMVLLRLRKNRDKNEPIFMLDGSGQKGDCIEELTGLFLDGGKETEISCKLSLPLIREQEMNLNPARYLSLREKKDASSDYMEETMRRLEAIDQRLLEIDRQKKVYELELGID